MIMIIIQRYNIILEIQQSYFRKITRKKIEFIQREDDRFFEDHRAIFHIWFECHKHNRGYIMT